MSKEPRVFQKTMEKLCKCRIQKARRINDIRIGDKYYRQMDCAVHGEYKTEIDISAYHPALIDKIIDLTNWEQKTVVKIEWIVPISKTSAFADKLLEIRAVLEGKEPTPAWIPIDKMPPNKELPKDFLLLFDNGEVYRMSEDHPFAVATHFMITSK